MTWWLIALNLLAWTTAAAGAFLLLRRAPRRPWKWGAALLLIALAGGWSLSSRRIDAALRVERKARQHYAAALDAQQRGELDVAQEELDRALALRPGVPEAERLREEIRSARPAEQRVQRREAEVDPQAAPAAPAPAGSAPAAALPSEPPPGPRAQKPKPREQVPAPFAIVGYALQVRLVPAAGELDAVATMRLKMKETDVRDLEFSLAPEFEPSGARVDGLPVPFEHPNDLLRLKPLGRLKARMEATVRVEYRRRGGPEMKDRPGLVSSRGCYFLADSRWYPATGELDFRAPVRVDATVPRGYSVVSVGKLAGIEKSGDRATFRWATDRPAAMIALAAGRYEQQSTIVAPTTPGARPPVKVTCFHVPAHRKQAVALTREAAAVLRYFERRFGAYPFEKLAVAEIPALPGGYGSTSFVMIWDRAVAVGGPLLSELLAHEIAHQWWGNSVFPQGYGAGWLTEGFANYSAWLYMAASRGNPRVLDRRVDQARRTYFTEVAEKGDQPLAETDPFQRVGAAEAIIYEKGAVVLHTLRHELGDETFFRLLRSFHEAHRLGRAAIPELEALGEHVCGRPLRPFFDQWLRREGGLNLTYRFDTRPAGPEHNEVVLQVTQSPVYQAEMNVKLQVDNTVETRRIQLEQERHEFRWPVKGKVTSVLFDPDGRYLMRPPRWMAEPAAP